MVGRPGEGEEEVQELRKQVRVLEERLAESQSGHAHGRRWTKKARTALAALLVVLASVVVPVTGVVLWVHGQVLDTDQFVSEVGPLSKNPDVASSLATIVTDRLFTQVDVEKKIKQALPDRVDFLASPLAGTVKSTTRAVTDKFIASDTFHRIWERTVRRAHEAMVGVLTGSSSSAVSADQNGTVKLDLHELAQNVVHQLDKRGITVFDKVPIEKIGGEVTLLKAPELVKLQGATRFLNKLVVALPLIALALYVAAVAVAVRRRRMLIWCGLGLSLAMALVAIALGWARQYLLDAAAGKAFTPAAAAAFFDALLHDAKIRVRAVFVIGLLVALTAWFFGPSRPMVAIRRGIGAAARRVSAAARNRQGALGALRSWAAAHSSGIQVGVLVAAALVLVWWGSPGIGGIVLVVIVASVLVVLARALSSPSGHDSPGARSAPSGHDSPGARSAPSGHDSPGARSASSTPSR